MEAESNCMSFIVSKQFGENECVTKRKMNGINLRDCPFYFYKYMKYVHKHGKNKKMIQSYINIE